MVLRVFLLLCSPLLALSQPLPLRRSRTLARERAQPSVLLLDMR